MCELQVFGLQAGSSLPFFEISGYGRVRVSQNWAGIYIQDPKLLGFFISNVGASGFVLRAGSSLAKLSSEGRAVLGSGLTHH